MRATRSRQIFGVGSSFAGPIKSARLQNLEGWGGGYRDAGKLRHGRLFVLLPRSSGRKHRLELI